MSPAVLCFISVGTQYHTLIKIFRRAPSFYYLLLAWYHYHALMQNPRVWHAVANSYVMAARIVCVVSNSHSATLSSRDYLRRWKNTMILIMQWFHWEVTLKLGDRFTCRSIEGSCTSLGLWAHSDITSQLCPLNLRPSRVRLFASRVTFSPSSIPLRLFALVLSLFSS